MEVIANGNTAEIYEYGNQRICKLFYNGYPQQYVDHEFNNAKEIWSLGIKSPKPHEIVSINGRPGIIYDKIIGEELSDKIRNSDQETWLNRFVKFQKDLFGFHDDNLMDYKDFLKLFASGAEELLLKIDGLDNGNSVIHGDFHPSNLMVDRTGTLILIDMMNVCKGSSAYDVARTYFLLRKDKDLQKKYLEKSGYKMAEIKSYLEVILLVREKELEAGNQRHTTQQADDLE